MSANLAIEKETNDVMMAYQGAMPWHSLGTRVEDPDVVRSVPAFLQAAHLDWKVVLKPLYYRQGDKLVKIDARRAVVRDSDNQLLATVGSEYHAIQNIDAFSILQPACEKLGVVIETAGALGVGDRVWMLAKLPKAIEPIPGDVIDNYLLVTTGHNGWTGYAGRLTQVRVVCANTWALAARDHAFVQLRHVATDAERLDEIRHVVTDMLAAAKKAGESYTRLAQRKMTLEETKAYIERVLDLDYDQPVAARRRDRVVELATRTGKGIELARGTAWAALNGVTEYIDHVRPAEAKATRTIRQANESAIFGANAKIKSRALDLALELVAA